MKVVEKCNHRWLITYDNSEYIKDLFSFANISEWNLMYGMRNQHKNSTQLGKEIFISNFANIPKTNKKTSNQVFLGL